MQDEERLGLLHEEGIHRVAADETEVPPEQLADEQSCFIECEGIKVHYRVQQPRVGVLFFSIYNQLLPWNVEAHVL